MVLNVNVLFYQLSVFFCCVQVINYIQYNASSLSILLFWHTYHFHSHYCVIISIWIYALGMVNKMMMVMMLL